MNKKLLIVIFIFISAFSFSQNINRGELAITIFEELFGIGDNPLNYPASQFPSPFLDLQEGAPLTDSKPYAILLSYLEFGDGVPIIDRSTILFDSPKNVAKIEFIRNALEAWDISPSNNTTLPYNDFPASYFHPDFGYMRKAYELGLLPNTTNIYPYSYVSYSYVNNFIDDLNNITSPPSQSDLDDLQNYFVPNNFAPSNLSISRGLEQGVFSHYAKNSFVIPDVKFNLNFSHYYSTAMVEIPEQYFPIKPLGRGWTHTYNSYITREDNVIGSDDFYNIVWADGTIQIYNEDDEEYITKGVYDDFHEYSSGDKIRITKKNQMRYYFERLDNDEQIFYLYRIRDRNGNRIDIDYETSDVDNDFERIKSVEAPSGKKLRFYYHENTDFIDYIKDPINRKIRFTYNEERLKYFYDAKNQRTKYYYVSNDEDTPDEHQYKRFLLRKIKLPRNNTIEAEYDSDNNGKLEKYTINDNTTTDIDVRFDYSSDTPITATVETPMPNGNTQDFEYAYNQNGMLTHFENDTHDLDITYPTSALNPLLPSNTNLNGIDIDYIYYADGGDIATITKNNDIEENFGYTDDYQLRWHQNANGNYTRFYYDNDGNLERIKDALSNNSYFTYDSHGQLKSTTNQEGISVNYTYENDGAVSTITAPEGISSSFLYDGVNRLKFKTVNGQTSSYNYDPNDNLKTQTNIGGYTTSFDYDANDNLIKITNANNVPTIFTYNDKGQLTSETFGSSVKQYEYNDDGVVDKYIKPSGLTINYDYTSKGQLNSVGSITDIDYYSSNGLIKRIYNSDGHYKFFYNNLNRLERVEDEFNNEEIEYRYDDVGNITRIYYPDSPIDLLTRYYYDDKNRLEKIRIRVNGSYKTVVEYEYLDDDRLDNIFYDNDIEVRYNHDDAGRLTEIHHIKHFSNGGNDGLFSQELVLNNKGNILSDTSFYGDDNESNSLSNSQAETYDYTNTNFITQAGNDSMTVNIDGNTVQKGGVNYQYNIEDKLIHATGTDGVNSIDIHNTFDPYGNRIKKHSWGNNTKYVWDIVNNNILEENNSSGRIFYIHGVSGLELSVNAQTGQIINYYHGDIRGSVVFKSDVNGDLRGTFNKYDDFGFIVYGGSGGGDNFKYLGKHGIYADLGTHGLYNIKARYYDAKLGRFLTQDPIWSTNLYPYANNNPISNIDSNGKWLETALDVASIGLSLNDYNNDPSLINSAFLVWDVISLIPGIPGSYVVKGGQYFDEVVQGGGALLNKSKNVGFFANTKYSEDVLSKMQTGDFHNFPELVKNYQSNGIVTSFIGGDGKKYSLLQINGSYGGRNGVFEFIKDSYGLITHRLFRPF